MFQPFQATGIGIHTGISVTAVVSPAPPGSGTIFVRDTVEIPARGSYLDDNPALCTTLTRENRSVRTVEHLLAALAAVGEKDVCIAVDGPELPILDGSAAPWLRMLRERGASGSFRFSVLEEGIEISSGNAHAVVTPCRHPDQAFLEATLDLTAIGMGMQHRRFRPEKEPFDVLASARTFALEKNIVEMRKAGYAKGGSLENALVIGEGGVLNPEGARFTDEAVRHKIVDAIGDLSLLGALPRAKISLFRPGHHLLHKMVRRIENVGFRSM